MFEFSMNETAPQKMFIWATYWVRMTSSFFFSDKEALPISLKNDNSIESQDREIFHIVSARRFLFLVKPGVFHCSFRKGSMLI